MWWRAEPATTHEEHACHDLRSLAASLRARVLISVSSSSPTSKSSIVCALANTQLYQAITFRWPSSRRIRRIIQSVWFWSLVAPRTGRASGYFSLKRLSTSRSVPGNLTIRIAEHLLSVPELIQTIYQKEAFLQASF